MVKVIKKNLSWFSVFMVFLSIMFVVIPTYSFAQNELVYECKGIGLTDPKPGDCSFEDLVAAIKHILDKVTVFALEFSVVVIAFAGYKYMISGDNPGERKSANRMLQMVGIGIFFMLAAWLIVTFVFNALVSGDIPKFLG